MKKNKAGTAENGKSSDVASFSLIIFLIDKLAAAIYHALGNGFFGKLLTAYSKEQAAFEQGFLKHHFTSGTKFRLYFRNVREYLSRAFETSFFLNKINRHSHGFLAMPLKFCGNFLFSFGAYTILVFLVRWLVPGLTESDMMFALIGAAVCIVSFPMLLSRDNIATAIGKGVLTKGIFVNALGFREESFQVKTKTGRAKSNLMILLGMLLGILTLFVHPITILLSVGTLLCIALVLSAPEIGVVMVLFFLPFLSFFESPAIFLGMMILITMISYFIKLIRGKRILKLEIMDLSVLLFMLTLYFSGTITAGGIIGYHEVLISCVLMFGYFLVVNLMRTEQWLNRCVLALVSSATIVAMIGIGQYVLGIFSSGAWIDTSYFSDIQGRVVSLFENPNVLAFYLVMILPFALLLLVRAKERKEKTLCWFSVAAMLVCVVLTWSRGAWLAAILTVLLFALIYSKKTVRLLISACFVVPFLSFFLPQSITKRFLSIGNLADSSTMYRYYTWKGSFRAIQEYWIGGVGYGPAAYQAIYPQYAYAGIEAAEHSHNLFLQILFGMGIGGLVIFLVVILLSTQMNLEYLKYSKDRDTKLMVSAAMCGTFAALVMGLFDFIWSNYRVFFLFWVILAMSCACVRIGNDERRRHGVTNPDEASSATLDIKL